MYEIEIEDDHHEDVYREENEPYFVKILEFDGIYHLYGNIPQEIPIFSRLIAEASINDGIEVDRINILSNGYVYVRLINKKENDAYI